MGWILNSKQTSTLAICLSLSSPTNLTCSWKCDWSSWETKGRPECKDLRSKESKTTSQPSLPISYSTPFGTVNFQTLPQSSLKIATLTRNRDTSQKILLVVSKLLLLKRTSGTNSISQLRFKGLQWAWFLWKTHYTKTPRANTSSTRCSSSSDRSFQQYHSSWKTKNIKFVWII